MGFPNLSLRSGVSAIAGGGAGPGWVSGEIASLAASGTATVIFDLGPNWQAYGSVQIAVVPAGPSSGLSNVTVRSSDDATFSATADPTLNSTNATTFGTGIAASVTTPQSSFVAPMGRFLGVIATNADGVNAQGATAFVQICAYPNSGM